MCLQTGFVRPESHQPSTTTQSKRDKNSCNLLFKEDFVNFLCLSLEYATHNPASASTIPSEEEELKGSEKQKYFDSYLNM